MKTDWLNARDEIIGDSQYLQSMINIMIEEANNLKWVLEISDDSVIFSRKLQTKENYIIRFHSGLTPLLDGFDDFFNGRWVVVARIETMNYWGSLEAEMSKLGTFKVMKKKNDLDWFRSHFRNFLKNAELEANRRLKV